MKVTQAEFEQCVREAIAEIPDELRQYLENVVIEIEDMPGTQDLAELGIDDPSEVLGLYHGVPMTERGVEGDLRLPDRISIYQRNIEMSCESREEIVEQIRITVLHEIGHHFGMDEDDLFDVGYD